MKNRFKNMLSFALDAVPCFASFSSFIDFKKSLCDVAKQIDYTTESKAVASRIGGGKFCGTVKL